MQPVAVNDRCELLSEAWVVAARAYLAEQVAQHPGLAATRFSLCETFKDAPESVADADGVAAWHFALSSGTVTVGRGARTDCDVTISGAYQTALGFAQLVFAVGPEAVQRGHQELAHRWGESALNIRGHVPAQGGIRELLSGLHDHLAAHTVENPDLDHRIRALGLESQARQLSEDGYPVVERAISPAFADELCALTAAEVTRHHPLTTNGLMMRDPRFEAVVQNTDVCALAQTAVGQNMVLGAMSGTYKLPGPGAIPLHADYPLVRDPYPEFGLIAVAVWSLQDWQDESSGPTWVLPGSHRNRRAPKRDEDLSGAVPILMPKGSALLISHGIWHWQGERTAPGARVAMHVTYNRVFVRQLDDFSSVDAAYYARNPPAFATLMGQDDPFGKSSFTGHDGARFAYAGRFVQT